MKILKAPEYFCGLLKRGSLVDLMWTLNSLAIDAGENSSAIIPFQQIVFIITPKHLNMVEFVN